MKHLHLFLWLCFIVFSSPSTNIGQSAQPAQILEAIDNGSRYACETLIAACGQSKCDYNLLDGIWYDYEPAWHTGQMIYGLTRAYDVTKNPRYLQAAKKAGDWWISLAITDHPVLKGMMRAIHGDGIDYIIFATISDGTAGLFRLYQRTGDDRYARVPTTAGEWMYAHMWEPKSRMFYDAIDPQTGEVLKQGSPFWEGKKNQTLNNVARPNNEGSLYKDIYQYTKDEKYKILFLQICESLVEKQGSEGLWMDFTPNVAAKGTFHPRFNIWYAESLLDGYDLTGDKRYLDAALKTARFYTKFQQSNGAFYYSNKLDGSADLYSISGSTTSFAGILWLRLQKYSNGKEFQANIDRSLSWVLENRYPWDHPDKNLAGGFMEIRSKGGKGKIRILQRDIATSFGVRFLCDYYEQKMADSKK